MGKFWGMARDAADGHAILVLKEEFESDSLWWDIENPEITAPADFLEALAQFDGERLTVEIDTYGGNVDVGMGIYRALKARKGENVAHVRSKAMSSGTLPLMACTERLMSPDACIMIHDPSACVWGADPECLRSAADWLEQLRDAVAEVYCGGTGLDRETVLQLMSDESFFGFRQAQRTGFATGILDAAQDKEDAFMRYSREGLKKAAGMEGKKLAGQLGVWRQAEERSERAELARWARGE